MCNRLNFLVVFNFLFYVGTVFSAVGDQCNNENYVLKSNTENMVDEIKEIDINLPLDFEFLSGNKNVVNLVTNGLNPIVLNKDYVVIFNNCVIKIHPLKNIQTKSNLTIKIISNSSYIKVTNNSVISFKGEFKPSINANLFNNGVISNGQIRFNGGSHFQLVSSGNESLYLGDMSGENNIELNISTSGSSKVIAKDISFNDALIKSSGYFLSELNVVKSLNLKSDGFLNIKYSGNPNLQKKISGYANVEKIN